MDSRPRRHSREVRNSTCDRTGCSVQGVIYKCQACRNRFYCSIECQRLDWATHSCRQTPKGGDELLGWMRANVRVRKRTNDPRATTDLERHGYLGSGSDAHVLGTVIDGQALALKLCFDDATLEAAMHSYLYHHTHAASSSGAVRLSAAVVALHTHWTANVDLRTLVLSMHPGAPIPNRDEKRLVSLLEKEVGLPVQEKRAVVGLHLEFMPMSVGDLWAARATTNDQFDNIYAQLIGCLGVMQPARFTHTDPHAWNARLIGSGARRIVYRMPSGAYYELPLRADIHAGGGINGTRAVFGDFGRCVVGALGKSLAKTHNWEVPPEALSTTGGNAGLDMWLMAVDIVRQTLPGCLPPSIIQHLVPRRNQVAELRLHAEAHNVPLHVIGVLELAVHAAETWTNIDVWDATRAAIEREHADGGRLNLHAPWPPQFYRSPEEALCAFGLTPAQRPTSQDATLVEWSD